MGELDENADDSLKYLAVLAKLYERQNPPIPNISHG